MINNANFVGRERVIMIALILLSLIPLLWPNIPPISDLYVNIGRYSIAHNLATDPVLQRYYSYNWALIPNLGVDLMVKFMAPLIGVEPAAKLSIMGIIAATGAALLLLARQAHGRITAAVLFALPLAYGYPFQFGFVNFCLSMALALLGFYLWMRLGDAKKLKMRAALFVPLAVVVWVAHGSGWGALGLCVFAAEIIRHRDAGAKWLRTLFSSGFHCLPLTAPLALMVTSHGGGAQMTGQWFNWLTKFQAVMMALSDRWQLFDIISIEIILFIIAAAMVLRTVRFDRRLGLAALFLFIAYLLLPWALMGSTFADMRLASFVIAIALIAIDVRPGAAPQLAKYMMIAGAAFFLVRTTATTVSFARYEQDIREELKVLPNIPVGSRVAAFIDRPCESQWSHDRRMHLPSIGLARRSLFVNDQYSMSGVQLVGVHYPAASGFTGDPSQIVVHKRCPGEDWRTFPEAIDILPRSAFDYVWLINIKDRSGVDFSGLTLVWQQASSTLYKIDR
jgi:hypothetical protein